MLALALFTPSTGFILDSLPQLGLDGQEQFWVKSKAIATELVALVALFVVLQSSSAGKLALSVVALAGLVAVLPVTFRFFAKRVAPYAPKSEFAFLLMIAIVAAYVTRKLGACYLVGAFVVGMVAQRLRRELPDFTSEKMLDALEVFASFFVPFYFFSAGLSLRAEDLSVASLAVGLALLATALPLNLGTIALHRYLSLGERPRASLRVAVSLSPTLIFTLVLAKLLRETYLAPSWLVGGLYVYAVGTTLLPAFALRKLPEFESPHVPEIEVEERPSARNDDNVAA